MMGYLYEKCCSHIKEQCVSLSWHDWISFSWIERNFRVWNVPISCRRSSPVSTNWIFSQNDWHLFPAKIAFHFHNLKEKWSSVLRKRRYIEIQNSIWTYDSANFWAKRDPLIHLFVLICPRETKVILEETELQNGVQPTKYPYGKSV